MELRSPNMDTLLSAVTARRASQSLRGPRLEVMMYLMSEATVEGRWPSHGEGSARDIADALTIHYEKAKRVLKELRKLGFIDYSKSGNARVYDIIAKRNETINSYVLHNREIPEHLLHPPHLEGKESPAPKPSVVNAQPAPTQTTPPEVFVFRMSDEPALKTEPETEPEQSRDIVEFIRPGVEISEFFAQALVDWVEVMGKEHVLEHIRYANRHANKNYIGFLNKSIEEGWDVKNEEALSQVRVERAEPRWVEEENEPETTWQACNRMALEIVGSNAAKNVGYRAENPEAAEPFVDGFLETWGISRAEYDEACETGILQGHSAVSFRSGFVGYVREELMLIKEATGKVDYEFEPSEP